MKNERKEIGYKLYFDGASKSNREAGIGYIIYDLLDNSIFLKGSKYIGNETNNKAEYLALVTALRELKKKIKIDKIKLTIYTDSLLIVNQVKGIYKVKSPNLINLYLIVTELLQFTDYTINHIPREENNIADALANQGVNKE